MKRSTITLLAALMVSCGVVDDSLDVDLAEGTLDQQIRNGDVANAPQYRGVGAVLGSSSQVKCSASLISKSMVLTAAQCVFNASPTQLRFAIGQGDESLVAGEDFQRVAEVKVVKSHPRFVGEYGPNLTFDLALVRLEKSESRAWKDVVRYGVAAADMPTQVVGTSVGYGETAAYPAGTRTFGEFMVSRYVAGEGDPGQVYKNAFMEVQPGNDKDQMICPGDSGGPMLHEGMIAGVASFGSVSSCDQQRPGYLVSTPRFADWIEEQLNEFDPPGACNIEDTEEFATTGGGCGDLESGLVWSAPADGLYTQARAAEYCDALVEGGNDDWRLASRDEMRDLDQHMWWASLPPWFKCHASVPLGPKALDVNGRFWTSTVNGAITAFQFDFSWHKQKNRRRSEPAKVICVRTPA